MQCVCSTCAWIKLKTPGNPGRPQHKLYSGVSAPDIVYQISFINFHLAMPRLSAPPLSPPSSTWLRLSISLQPEAWQPQLTGRSCCLAACNSKPERAVCLRCCLFRVLRCVRLPNHVWMNNDTNLTKHKMYRRKEGRRLHKRHAAQKCIHASKCASEK